MNRTMPLFEVDNGGASGELGGPWSEDVDGESAALPMNRGTTGHWTVPLLSNGGRTMASEGTVGNGRLLVVSNASFLLNASLLNKARRPLAARAADWVGAFGPRRVVFVEGHWPLSQAAESNLFRMLFVDPLTWVVPHLILFGALAVAARAVRLGRPRQESSGGADRPAAHAEALGDLMVRGKDDRAVKAQIDAYRRWRSARAASQLRRPKGDFSRA